MYVDIVDTENVDTNRIDNQLSNLCSKMLKEKGKQVKINTTNKHTITILHISNYESK